MATGREFVCVFKKKPKGKVFTIEQECFEFPFVELFLLIIITSHIIV